MLHAPPGQILLEVLSLAAYDLPGKPVAHNLEILSLILGYFEIVACCFGLLDFGE